MSITITRQDRGWLLEATQRIARPHAEVFPFYGDARNLEQITPDTMRFRILNHGPIEMRAGTVIDYRLRLRGLPVRWRSEITAWEPPYRFVDEQRRGPYRWWRHEHLFHDEGPETLVEDRIAYGVLGGSIVHTLFVARELRGIFRYRQERLARLFGGDSDGARRAAALQADA